MRTPRRRATYEFAKRSYEFTNRGRASRAARGYHRGVPALAPPMSPAQVAFVEQAVAILVGTCDAAGVPEAVRAAAVAIAPDRARATVLVPEAMAARTLANLQANPRLAVTTADLPTFATVQLKGTVTAVRAATASEQPRADGYRARFAREFAWAGADLLATRPVATAPCVAIELTLTAIHTAAPDPLAP